MKDLYDDGRHYDALFPGPDDLPFYRRQIAAYGGPVLELACGTGRLTVPLRAEGADITGIDVSPSMLRAASANAARHGVDLPLIKADVRDYSLGRKFQLIFIAHNSLGHLLTRADLEACLRCTRNHLAEDGRFVIDIFTPSVALLARDGSTPRTLGEYADPDGGGKIVVTETSRYDAAAQVHHALWRYQLEGTQENWEIPFAIRMYYPQEIDALAAHNGFTIERKYGWFDERLYDSTSPKQLIVCRCAR